MTRRSAVLVTLALVAALFAPSTALYAAGCTRVLGGSQTNNWYNAGFESLVVDADWERQSAGGKNVSTWGIGGTGWSVQVWSPCAPTGILPTRVVLHVLPSHDVFTVEGISGHIQAALAGIAASLPTVSRVTLIPPIHGVRCDHITLSARQPATVEAINLNLSESVDAGPAVVVPDCSYFRDLQGHLTSAGAEWVAAQLAASLPDGDPPPPGPDIVPPTTSITSPVSGAVVSRSIKVTVAASDNVGVTSVELKVDGVVVGTVTAAPYEFRWNTKTVANGTHTLTATAFDAAGNSGSSSDETITVTNRM